MSGLSSRDKESERQHVMPGLSGCDKDSERLTVTSGLSDCDMENELCLVLVAVTKKASDAFTCVLP